MSSAPFITSRLSLAALLLGLLRLLRVTRS
jgi:hypothetical protein